MGTFDENATVFVSDLQRQRPQRHIVCESAACQQAFFSHNRVFVCEKTLTEKVKDLKLHVRRMRLTIYTLKYIAERSSILISTRSRQLLSIQCTIAAAD